MNREDADEALHSNAIRMYENSGNTFSVEHAPETYDRDGLIDLCNAGVVPEKFWWNRDSAGAQLQLAECRALLLAGCEYRPSDDPATDERTVWIEVTYRGFDWVEMHQLSEKLFYLPTVERLRSVNGKDWY